MLIDTHCHLDMIMELPQNFKRGDENYQKAKNIIDAALQKKVTKIINIGIDYERSLKGIALSQAFDTIFCTIGIHPCDATRTWKEDFAKIKKLLEEKKTNKIVGIGESGLDFYHPGFVVERQEALFRAHIELALEHNLALVVHTRSSIDETLKILQEYRTSNLRGVVHCFSEDWSIAQEIIDMNFMLGIGGIITYPKNDCLREVVHKDQLKNVILETDAPFLPPQIIRGKKNSPAHIRTIAEYIAELLSWKLEDVAQITTKNAETLFQLN